MAERTEVRTLTELAAAVAQRGWLFELITVFATYQAGPPRRMVAQAYLGRILTPDGEIEWSDLTPRRALAGAYDFACQMQGDAPGLE